MAHSVALIGPCRFILLAKTNVTLESTGFVVNDNVNKQRLSVFYGDITSNSFGNY